MLSSSGGSAEAENKFGMTNYPCWDFYNSLKKIDSFEICRTSYLKFLKLTKAKKAQ